MHSRTPTFVIVLAFLLHFISTLGLASPAIQLSTVEIIDAQLFLNNTATMLAFEISPSYAQATRILASTNEDGNHIFVDLEPGFKVQTCAPNLVDPWMCTLAYAERSTWGGWGRFWLYDNRCNLLGGNDHVARNWVANRWSLTSSLPWTAEIKIPNSWTPKHDKGPEIWYGPYHNEPFNKPIHTSKESFVMKTTLATKTPHEVFAVFRAPFNCGH